MEHKYWTYIVASLSGTIYIGMTNDIERRTWEHKSGAFEGFAAEHGCVRLVYYESFDDVRKATAFGWRLTPLRMTIGFVSSTRRSDGVRFYQLSAISH